MLPSASLGDPSGPGVFEPCHGSAPDIAGQDKANPLVSKVSWEALTECRERSLFPPLVPCPRCPYGIGRVVGFRSHRQENHRFSSVISLWASWSFSWGEGTWRPTLARVRSFESYEICVGSTSRSMASPRKIREEIDDVSIRGLDAAMKFPFLVPIRRRLRRKMYRDPRAGVVLCTCTNRVVHSREAPFPLLPPRAMTHVSVQLPFVRP